MALRDCSRRLVVLEMFLMYGREILFTGLNDYVVTGCIAGHLKCFIYEMNHLHCDFSQVMCVCVCIHISGVQYVIEGICDMFILSFTGPVTLNCLHLASGFNISYFPLWVWLLMVSHLCGMGKLTPFLFSKESVNNN